MTAARPCVTSKRIEIPQADFMTDDGEENMSAARGGSSAKTRKRSANGIFENEDAAEWVEGFETDGPRAVLVMSRESDRSGQSTECRWRITPLVVKVVNPIGCGDCFTAGLAWATQQGHDTLAAIRTGIAAAAVNAGQLLPARIEAQTLAAAMASATRIVPS